MVEELSAVLIKKSSVADTKNLAEAKKLFLGVYNCITSQQKNLIVFCLLI